MAWTIEDLFPDWGEEGEFPTDGFFYDGGDQVNEKHLDALWNGVKEFEGNVRDALSDLDSDGDGIVDDSDQFAGTGPEDGVDGQALTTDGTSTQWSAIDPSGNDIAPTTLSVQDWNWVDVTEASDVATDGSADAVPELDTLVASDTLLIFPEGTYRFDQTFSAVDVDNFGMIARGDVTIESNNGTGNLVDFGNGDEVGILFEGFDIDVATNANQGGRQITANVEDRLLIKDITQVGQPTAGDTPFTTFQITSESGFGKVENLDLSAGDNSSDGNGHVGVLCSSGHVGQISFEDCHVEGFLSNGMYLSGGGRYHIHGGVYKNSSTGQLRLNGGPAYVTGAEIVVDDATGLSSPRGVWWRGSGPHHIENSEIRVEVTSGSDPISVPTAESPGGLIENTKIRDERNGWATRINAVDLNATDDQSHSPLIFDGVQWEYNKHHGDNDQDIYAIRVHRPSTYFRDCEITDFDGDGSLSIARIAVQVRAANVHFRGGTIDNDGWCVNVNATADPSEAEFDHITFSELSAYSDQGPDEIYESIVIGADGNAVGDNPTEADESPHDVRINNVNTNSHAGLGWNRYGVVDFGNRTLIDGVGQNAGDPNESGAWNDTTDISADAIYRWQPGARVVDTISGDIYEYNGETDEWVSFEQVEPVKNYETVGASQERQDIRTRSVSAGTLFANYDRAEDPDHLHVMVGTDPTVNFDVPTSTDPTVVSLSGDHNETYPLRREVTVTLQNFNEHLNAGGADKEACAIGENYYAVGDVNGNVHIRTINRPQDTLGVLDDADSAIANMDFGENILAVSTGGSETYYYEIGTWNLLQNISAGHPVDGISVGGTDDEYVALGARGGYVRVYDTSTWTELHEFTDTGGEIVRDVDMDDEWLVYGSWDSNTYVRPVNPDSSTAVGPLAATLDDHVAADVNVEAVAVAEGYVFHGGGNNEVYVYDTSDFSLATTLTEPGFIQSMGATSNDLSPGGSDYGYFAVGDGDGNANVYDIGAWNNVDTYSHSDNIFGVDVHEAMTVRAARANGDGLSINERGSSPFTITWGGNATITWDGGSETTEIANGETVEIRLTSQDGGYSWRARTAATYS